ncbi:MAG: hypothetical protein ACXWL2_00565 [Candidatus Chromulinivorax sp.]
MLFKKILFLIVTLQSSNLLFATKDKKNKIEKYEALRSILKNNKFELISNHATLQKIKTVSFQESENIKYDPIIDMQELHDNKENLYYHEDFYKEEIKNFKANVLDDDLDSQKIHKSLQTTINTSLNRNPKKIKARQLEVYEVFQKTLEKKEREISNMYRDQNRCYQIVTCCSSLLTAATITFGYLQYFQPSECKNQEN